MKQVYPNVIHLANSPADRVAALEDLCRTKVAEVLQAYLNAEADELIRRRPYQRTEEGVPVIYRNGHDPERLITTPAGPRSKDFFEVIISQGVLSVPCR